MKRVVHRMACGLVGIALALHYVSVAQQAQAADALDEANELVDAGNACVVEANRLTAEAGKRYQAIFTSIDETGFPEGRAAHAAEVQAVAALFLGSADKYRQAGGLFERAATKDLHETLREYYTLESKFYRKMADVKQAARESVLSVLDEYVLTVEDLIEALNRLGERINALDAEAKVLEAAADRLRAENPELIAQATPSDSTPAPAAATAGFAGFVETLSRFDAAAVHGQLSADIQPLVDVPVLQLMLDVFQAELGAVRKEKPADYTSEPGEDEGVPYVREQGTVACERGSLVVTTVTSEGKYIGFNIEAPTVEPIDPKMYARVMDMISNSSDAAKKVAEFYGNRCEEFLEVLFQQSAAAAYDSLHPGIQAQMPREETVATINQLRDRFGPVKEAEAQTIGVTGPAAGQYDTLTIGVVMTKENGKKVDADFDLQFAGLQAVITGFNFSEDTDLLAPPMEEPSITPPPSAE